MRGAGWLGTTDAHSHRPWRSPASASPLRYPHPMHAIYKVVAYRRTFTSPHVSGSSLRRSRTCFIGFLFAAFCSKVLGVGGSVRFGSVRFGGLGFRHKGDAAKRSVGFLFAAFCSRQGLGMGKCCVKGHWMLPRLPVCHRLHAEKQQSVIATTRPPAHAKRTHRRLRHPSVHRRQLTHLNWHPAGKREGR